MGGANVRGVHHAPLVILEQTLGLAEGDRPLWPRGSPELLHWERCVKHNNVHFLPCSLRLLHDLRPVVGPHQTSGIQIKSNGTLYTHGIVVVIMHHQLQPTTTSTTCATVLTGTRARHAQHAQQAPQAQQAQQQAQLTHAHDRYNMHNKQSRRSTHSGHSRHNRHNTQQAQQAQQAQHSKLSRQAQQVQQAQQAQQALQAQQAQQSTQAQLRTRQIYLYTILITIPKICRPETE